VEYVSAGGFTDNATIAGGAMSLAGGADATTQISFAGAGSLSLAGSVFNTAPIAGFTAEDSITLSDIAYDIGGSVTMNDDDTALVIREGGQQYDLAFNGADGETFALQAAADGDSSTITENVLCYLRGTKILTPAGERAIEDLAIGDLVVTLFGGLQRINWIGRQSYDARFLRRHRGRIPVAIHPGALGENLPHRTLFVSPGHSMLIDGLIDGLVGGFAEDILVLARSLVNGITITQSLDDVPAIVEYFQVELDHHDCILAEGTWSETYADAPGMRAQFHNAAEYTELYPDAVQPDDLIPLCAPRPLEGPVLEAALRPLITHATAGRRHGALDGYIEVLTPSLITGWAIDITAPDLPLLLTLHAGDTILGTVLSCAHRADLLDAGKGNGNHGFAFTPAVPLDLALLPHVTISCAGGEVLPLASGCMVLAA